MPEYTVTCIYVRIHWSVCSVHQRTHVVRRQKFYFSGFNSVQTYSVFIYANLITKIILYLPVYIMFGYIEYEIEYCLYGHKGCQCFKATIFIIY